MVRKSNNFTISIQIKSVVMEKLMNKKEVALTLGVSVKAIDKWLGEGRLPYIRLSRKCIRFNPSEIQSFLKNLKVRPWH